MTDAPAPRSPFARALRNVGWLLTGKGVGAVLSLVYLGLATRTLGLDGFGDFMLILSVGQAVAAVVLFQSWQVVVRYGVPQLSSGDTAGLGRLVRFCAMLDIGGAVVGCVVVTAALWLLSGRFGWDGAMMRDAMLFCAVLMLSVRSSAIGVLRLHDRYGIGALAESATPIMRFVGALAVVATGPSVRGFLIAWAAAEVVTAIVHWRAVWRVAPGLMRGWAGTLSAPAEHPGLWQFALLTNVSATLNAASKQGMVILVGLVTGPAAAGAYRLAFQLSQALAQIAEMFSRGVFPEFSRADRGATRDDLKRLFRQSTRLTVAVGAVICLFVPLAGEHVLRLVGGNAYAGAWPLVLILSLAVAIDVMGIGFEPVLLGTGRAGAAFRIRLAAVVVLAVAAALLMPRLDALGAALATLAASSVALALLWPAASRAVRS
ncbi:lipopolysaccharide biosynthesis protein [Sphingomonas sp.]|uniref:lipopolysaccharide biosynthesis protein n=1 Tax=Sphingomonas sp. TaxID=28214 RepID=UPI002DD67918|nr:lipopolysaccharide biosynthesis protein [Sphingomonas sp.]